MTARSNRWVWRWYWVPYEPQWLIIPSIVWFHYAGREVAPTQWSLGIQWGRWFVGFGAYIYPGA